MSISRHTDNWLLFYSSLMVVMVASCHGDWRLMTHDENLSTQRTTERYSTLHPTTERFSTPQRTTERFTTPPTTLPTTERYTTPPKTTERVTTLSSSTMSETPSMSSETTFTPTEFTTSTVTPSSTTTISTTVTSSSTTPTSSSTTIGACPETPTCSIEEVDQKKPYPPDCTKFIYCTATGSSSLQDCPRMMHFGPELLYCADPEIANCPFCQAITAV